MADINLQQRKALAERIVELDKIYQKNQNRRTLLTIIFYTIANIFIWWVLFESQNVSMGIQSFLALLLISIICALFIYAVNWSIFSHVFGKNLEENEHINDLIKRFRELEKEVGIEHNTVEDRILNGHM